MLSQTRWHCASITNPKFVGMLDCASMTVRALHMPGYVGFEALGLDLPESRTRTYSCKLSKLLIDFTRRRWSEPSGRLHKQALRQLDGFRAHSLP